jgi:Metallo-peptidase family M12B Reprolysin-like
MTSVRALATCIGLTPSSISLVRDLFGYVTGAPRPLSLLKQARLLSGKFININLIEVGESFLWSDEKEIDFALDRMREIYAAPSVFLGIGRIGRYYIPEDKAAKMGIYNSILWDDDAAEITDEFSGPEGALDLFVVLAWGPEYGTLGRSATGGSCDKSYDACEMTGSVVSIRGTSDMRSGRTFAHEVGHYLGLEHLSEVVYPVCDPGPGGDIYSATDDDEIGSVYNLMADPDLYTADPDRPKGPCNYTVDPEIAVDLTPAQGKTMRSHCFVNPGCLD